MEESQDLKYKYDNYEEDFEKEENIRHEDDKNKLKVQFKESNMQTSFNEEHNHHNQTEEEEYKDDFVEGMQESRAAEEKEREVPIENMTKKSRIYQNNPNREKMIEQNIKLKTQIYQLAKQMDQIMQREKKQKKYGLHADEEEDQTILVKKAELKKQQIEIMNLKNKIFLTKRQLQHVYDSRGIQGKEDELKNLQKDLKVLQDEKDALLKVKKEQTKALKLIRNDNQYEEKIKSLKEHISKTKEECKHLSEKLLQNQRVLRKNHEIYITKQAKIKQMEAKIKENKQKNKKGQALASNIVTQQMINEIDQQINELQKQRKQAEKTWNDKIQTIENELQQRRVDEEKKLLILKDKEKQLKLNEIRIKELKKLIQHHTTEVTTHKKPEPEADMKEFRHKRNIKHLEK